MAYILFFFIFGTLIANLIGLRGISRTICFIIPFAILSVIITFFTSFENLDIKDFIMMENYLMVVGVIV